MKIYREILWLISIICMVDPANAQQLVSENKIPGYFAVVSADDIAKIYTDAKDFTLIQKSALLLQQDIESITGNKPGIINNVPPSAKSIIIIGSVERSFQIQQLIRQKK